MVFEIVFILLLDFPTPPLDFNFLLLPLILVFDLLFFDLGELFLLLLIFLLILGDFVPIMIMRNNINSIVSFPPDHFATIFKALAALVKKIQYVNLKISLYIYKLKIKSEWFITSFQYFMSLIFYSTSRLLP